MEVVETTTPPEGGVVVFIALTAKVNITISRHYPTGLTTFRVHCKCPSPFFRVSGNT